MHNQHEEENNLYGDALHSIQRMAEDTCPHCGRGAAGAASPTVDDLEACISIRDGFNKHRRSFTPLVEGQFRSFDKVISYLHRMIQGTRDV